MGAAQTTRDLCERIWIYEIIHAYVRKLYAVVHLYTYVYSQSIFMYIKCNSLIRIYPRVTMIMR